MLYQKKSTLMSLLLLLLLAIPMTVSADGDGPEWTGLVESRPAETHIGTWIIGGNSFEVNNATEVEFEYGPVNIGSCVKVEYYTSGVTNIATKLESEEPSDCGTSGGTGYAEAYGTITTMPAGYIGTWVIGGVSYTTTAATYFEQEDGLFAIGQCVEIKYNPTDSTTFKIETEDDCSGSGGGSSYAEIEGIVTSFPIGLIGTWVVNGISYEATSSTYFSQEDGPFITNACVEIRYNPTTQAVYKIETEDHCGGSTGGSGYVETYGTVDSFPASLVGAWVINGVSYTTTTTTYFAQHDGPFAVGACVEVRYSPTTSTVYKIETEHDCSGSSGGGGSYTRTYATLESFPVGLIGTWVANGVSYATSATTIFEQEHSAFTIGSCIEIDYLPATFAVLKIETESAYHCGGTIGGGHYGDDNERYGQIDSFPAGLTGTWMIDGIVYEAGASTQFEQEDGTFAVGSCVEVKSIIQGVTNIALEIETENNYHCGGTSGTPGSYQSVYRTLDSFPVALLGSWVVDGVTYTADMTTLFKPDDGAFANGVCVEIIFQTLNNLALEIETEDAYHCGNSTTPPSSDNIAGLHVNHATGADGSYFVYTGENLPADSHVTININGKPLGSALTNSTGWVTFAVEASSSRRATTAVQTVGLVVAGQSVDAPDVTLDNTQQQLSLPSSYSAPVVQTVLSPTAVTMSGISAEFHSTTLTMILLSVLLLTLFSAIRLAPRTQS